MKAAAGSRWWARRTWIFYATTAKDYARLPEAARPMVKVLGVELEWRDPGALASLLAAVVSDG